MLASGSRKGHRGEEGEAAVERKAVLGGRGALACGRGRGRGARFTGSLDLQKARGLENGPLPKRIPPFDDFLMSCDRVTTQRTQRNAIIVTTCPQSTLKLRARPFAQRPHGNGIPTVEQQCDAVPRCSWSLGGGFRAANRSGSSTSC